MIKVGVEYTLVNDKIVSANIYTIEENATYEEKLYSSIVRELSKNEIRKNKIPLINDEINDILKNIGNT